jgi:hypothetical protein
LGRGGGKAIRVGQEGLERGEAKRRCGEKWREPLHV